MSESVELIGLAKRFGEKYAVRDVDITINPGEFFSVLGPSGCGKTTVLRMVAGFIEPSEGQVRIGGRDMRGLGPDRRPTGMIFQSLALFPLMPVWENVAFGLEARGVAKAERRRRAEALLELVALGGYGDRLPGALRQFRLVIPQVEVRRGPGTEDVQHPLGFGRVVRLLRGSRRGCEQVREADARERGGGVGEQVAARRRKVHANCGVLEGERHA